VPARLIGSDEELIAVFERVEDDHPVYLMKVEWRDRRLSRSRDFRDARYILEGSEMVLTACCRRQRRITKPSVP
jgi:hypothetical protein